MVAREYVQYPQESEATGYMMVVLLVGGVVHFVTYTRASQTQLIQQERAFAII